MKTAMLVTDYVPVLVSTSCGSLAELGFAEALRDNGIDKFTACEVSLDRCCRLYPHHLGEQPDGLHDEPPVDVLDADGRRIVSKFPFAGWACRCWSTNQTMAIQVTP